MAQEYGPGVVGRAEALDGAAEEERLAPAAVLAIWLGLSALGWAAVIGLVSMII